jgi:NAD(P)-dependent dehydrogenase (short-subunit alcohol dehydrogenase family)
MGSMDGKLCLVTGATAGIGYFTALEIARMGASIVILGRDRTRCESSVKTIQEQSGNLSIEYLVADLSSQTQIRTVAHKFYEQHDHLDVLVNNAGGFFLRRKLSVDGIEMTLAVNHLAYFLLTILLIDALKKSLAARVINVSSGSHYNEYLDFNNLQLSKFYNPIQAYGRSKLANILFTYELARRLEGTYISSNALTPGMVATDIWKKVSRWLTPLINPVMQRIAQTPLQGAQTSIYLATSPEVEGVSGKYFADKKPIKSSLVSYDQVSAKHLWDVSLERVGLDKTLI